MRCGWASCMLFHHRVLFFVVIVDKKAGATRSYADSRQCGPAGTVHSRPVECDWFRIRTSTCIFQFDSGIQSKKNDNLVASDPLANQRGCRCFCRRGTEFPTIWLWRYKKRCADGSGLEHSTRRHMLHLFVPEYMCSECGCCCTEIRGAADITCVKSGVGLLL